MSAGAIPTDHQLLNEQQGTRYRGRCLGACPWVSAWGDHPMLTMHRYRNHLLSFVDGRADDFGVELYQAWFSATLAAAQVSAEARADPANSALELAAETTRAHADAELETYQQQVVGAWRNQLLHLS